MKRFILSIIIAVIITAIAAAAGISYVKSRHQRTPATTVQAPQAKVTVIEGWTMDDIARDLDHHDKREPEHLTTPADFYRIAQAFPLNDFPDIAHKPASSSLEGYLFPDTYFVPINASSPTASAETLIAKALANFERKFTPEMRSRTQELGMSVHQAVILASIVERETGRNAVSAEQRTALDNERKIIAGIFYNRLKAGMPLASDATINYVTKKNTPAVSEADTQIDTPYNTYRHAGLPPGPICNPSLSSLMAVLYPTSTDYYFFLHKQPSGEPVYSKTYEEHLLNKQKFLK